MPSFKLFSEQSKTYKQEVLKFNRENIIAVEPYVSFGLERFAEHVISIETYGASANAKDLAKFYGMDQEGIEKSVKAIMQ
ncbi:Transketolase [Hexamita inflata]|nr:Transketolase [Hexamita inflata]